MQREARCACGALRITTEGEPAAVVACHCLACQRRSGSVLGVGAYWPEAQVRIEGEARRFERPTALGNVFESHFCPTCGSTVYWRSARNPGTVGIGVGFFADPAFPAPVRSVWEQSRHPWVEVGCAQQHFPTTRVI